MGSKESFQAKVSSYWPASVVMSGGSSRTIPKTFSGELAASQAANNPPEEWPETTTGSPITFSINHTRSAPMTSA